MRLLPKSLEGLLLLNEGALLILVILSGGVGALSAYFWQQSSEQALRLATLSSHAERIRGDLYRQIEDVVRASLTEQSATSESHSGHTRRIEQHFEAMNALVADPRERVAADFLRDTYGVLQRDMAGVFADDTSIASRTRVRLLDRAQEQWMLAEFESALTILSLIVSARQEQLQQALDRWTKLAAILIPIPLALALVLALVSLHQLRRRILRPIQALAEGAGEFSGGNFDHRIQAAGVHDLVLLASAFNAMAGELKRSRDALVDAEREAALGALVPVVAHNIRNPLASIRATAQLIDADEEPGELAETRQGILDSVDHLERWLRSLLSYLNPLEPRLETVPFGDMVAAPLALVRPAFERRDLEVDYRLGRHAGNASADTALMEQAIYGLLNNAAEASPHGASVCVDVRVQGDSDGTTQWNVLTIDDEGIGMRIQPQAESGGLGVRPGATTKSYGTGLGIPFAFKVIQAHGGTLDFEPRASGGTRVTVKLKVCDELDDV